MYTIVVRNDNYPMTTIRRRIVQNSNLVDSLRFLVYPMYKNEDMNNYSVTMEYITPHTKTFKREALIQSSDGYKEYLQYILPISSELTSEYGDVKLRLNFICDKPNNDGSIIRYIRKTIITSLYITPPDGFDNVIPDDIPESDINTINQRIFELESQLGNINANKADDITLSEDRLFLTSNSNAIGSPIDLEDLSYAISENSPEGLIKIVEF